MAYVKPDNVYQIEAVCQDRSPGMVNQPFVRPKSENKDHLLHFSG